MRSKHHGFLFIYLGFIFCFNCCLLFAQEKRVEEETKKGVDDIGDLGQKYGTIQEYRDGKSRLVSKEPPKHIVQHEIYSSSPFAIHDPGFPTFENDITEIGAKWVRYAGGDGIVWDCVEREKGIFNWTRNDELFLKTYKMGVKMFVSTISVNKLYGVEHGYKPENMRLYINFLRKAVERYDGDGIDDAPGSPVIDVWQIENELDIFWKDSPENYAILLKESYKIIKEENPNALVAISGVGTPDGFDGRKKLIYTQILDKLNLIIDNPQDKYFEVFDFHWYPFQFDYNYMIEPPVPLPDGKIYYLKEGVNNINRTLLKYGYKNIPIFITETAQYSGTPSSSALLSQFSPEVAEKLMVNHSEAKQAIFLIKQYIYSLACGVKKIFWVTLTEWHNFGGEPDTFWDNVGLINNPQNGDKLSHKKLSYYTYKKMVEVLEGSDWDHIETVQEQTGICIYKFIKNGKPIWVAWNDNKEEKEITIAGIYSNQVKVTEAVPKYESGKNVMAYRAAFRTEIKTASTGQITLTLGEIPVFVEE